MEVLRRSYEKQNSESRIPRVRIKTETDISTTRVGCKPLTIAECGMRNADWKNRSRRQKAAGSQDEELSLWLPSAFSLFNPQSEIRIPQSKDNGGMKFQGLHAAVRRKRRPATTLRFLSPFTSGEC